MVRHGLWSKSEVSGSNICRVTAVFGANPHLFKFRFFFFWNDRKWSETDFGPNQRSLAPIFVELRPFSVLTLTCTNFDFFFFRKWSETDFGPNQRSLAPIFAELRPFSVLTLTYTYFDFFSFEMIANGPRQTLVQTRGLWLQYLQSYGRFRC